MESSTDEHYFCTLHALRLLGIWIFIQMHWRMLLSIELLEVLLLDLPFFQLLITTTNMVMNSITPIHLYTSGYVKSGNIQ